MTEQHRHTPASLGSMAPEAPPWQQSEAAPAMGRRRAMRRKGKRSALFSGTVFEAYQPLFERVLGLAILSLSFAGTMALLNGGWKLPLRPAGLAFGFGIQVLCTLAEWIYRRRRWSFGYLIAIGFDAGTSVAGFHELLAPWLGRVLASVGVTGPLDMAIWGVMIGIALLVAIVPEAILID